MRRKDAITKNYYLNTEILQRNLTLVVPIDSVTRRNLKTCNKLRRTNRKQRTETAMFGNIVTTLLMLLVLQLYLIHWAQLLESKASNKVVKMPVAILHLIGTERPHVPEYSGRIGTFCF